MPCQEDQDYATGSRDTQHMFQKLYHTKHLFRLPVSSLGREHSV